MKISEYKLVCTCGERWTKVSNHHQIVEQECPKCKSASGVSIDRSDLLDGVPSGRQFTGRNWTGQERVWLEGPTIKPEHVANWQRDVGKDFETDSKGKIVFNSDAHQRRIFKAISEVGAHHRAK